LIIAAPASPERRIDSLLHRLERGSVKDLRDRIPHFLHDEPGAAAVLIPTLLAFYVRFFTRARQGRQRPVEYSDDLPEGNRRRAPGQEIAAPFSFLAVDDALMLELQKDELEKFLGDALPLREIGDQRGPRSVVAGERIQRLQRILGFLGHA